MNKILLVGVFCLAFGWMGLVVNCQTGEEISSPEADDLEAMESYLRTAEVVRIDRDMDLGTTDPWIVTLDDGTQQRRAMFKYAPRCRPLFPLNCYKYEIAAYELSKLLQLPIVPPVVERRIDGTPGALQVFVEGCIPLKDFNQLHIEDVEQFHRSMLEILVFDNLTYWDTGDDDINEDILVHPSDGKVCRVDFSKAFEPKSELLEDRGVEHCTEKLYRALEALDPSAVRENLANYLNEDEIEAVIARRQLLLDRLGPSK
jgi:hypothetical protein